MIRLLMQLNPPPSLCPVPARGREARKHTPSNASRPIWVLFVRNYWGIFVPLSPFCADVIYVSPLILHNADKSGSESGTLSISESIFHYRPAAGPSLFHTWAKEQGKRGRKAHQNQFSHPEREIYSPLHLAEKIPSFTAGKSYDTFSLFRRYICVFSALFHSVDDAF